jgi:hypothetical protein
MPKRKINDFSEKEKPLPMPTPAKRLIKVQKAFVKAPEGS